MISTKILCWKYKYLHFIPWVSGGKRNSLIHPNIPACEWQSQVGQSGSESYIFQYETTWESTGHTVGLQSVSIPQTSSKTKHKLFPGDLYFIQYIQMFHEVTRILWKHLPSLNWHVHRDYYYQGWLLKSDFILEWWVICRKSGYLEINSSVYK